MRKKPDWLPVLVEMVTGPMVAILFWITVLLIVLMTFAHGKFFEANFFEAFGAIGQVAFAGAVFWLGWQQFKFTKSLAIRQEKITTYELRRKLLHDLKGYEHMFSLPHHIRTSDADKIYELWEDVVRTFSEETGDLMQRFFELVSEMAAANSSRRGENRDGLTAEQRVEIDEKVEALATEAFDLFYEVQNAMDLDMDINHQPVTD